MSRRPAYVQPLLKSIGIGSPYFAVVIGVFLFINGFAAVLFYHIVLAAAIATHKINPVHFLLKGFRPVIGPLICLGGLLPGVVILLLWAFAKQESVDLSDIFLMLNLHGRLFTLFAVYACLVNPILEESFWRGCLKNNSRCPSGVDMLFAGYHALAVFPVLKPVFVVFVFTAMVFVGWLFRSLYRLTGGLFVPLMTHIIADIAILFAIRKIIQ